MKVTDAVRAPENEDGKNLIKIFLNRIIWLIFSVAWILSGCLSDGMFEDDSSKNQVITSSTPQVSSTSSSVAIPVQTPTATPVQNLSVKAKLAKNLIVKITNRDHIGDVAFFGAGIIFGRFGNYLYIATANHVIQPNRENTQDLWAEFAFLPGDVKLKATLRQFDQVLDLAVLRVTLQDNEISISQFDDQLLFDHIGYLTDVNENLTTADEVYPIGHPLGKDFFVPVTPYRVHDIFHGSIYFEGDCHPGHSGGGLFNNYWILLGVIRGTNGLCCEAISFEKIYETLVRWRLPVNLPPRDSTLTVTPTALPTNSPTPPPTPTPSSCVFDIVGIFVNDTSDMSEELVDGYSIKPGESITVTVVFTNPCDHDFEIIWSTISGRIEPIDNQTTTYTAPNTTGGAYIKVEVLDKKTGEIKEESINIDVTE